MSALSIYGIGLLGVFVLTLVAAFRDFRAYIIPNWISAAIAALFFITALATWIMGAPQVSIVLHVLISALVGLTLLVLFAGGHLGGGDVKLLTAISLWAGPGHIVPLLLVTTLAGGVLALVIMLVNRINRSVLTNAGPSNETTNFRTDLPYGIAIMVGMLWLTAKTLPWLFGL